MDKFCFLRLTVHPVFFCQTRNDQPNPKYDGFSVCFCQNKPTEKTACFGSLRGFSSHHQVAVSSSYELESL